MKLWLRVSWEMHYSPIDPTLATQENEDCEKTHGRNSWGQTYIMQDIHRNMYIPGSTACYFKSWFNQQIHGHFRHSVLIQPHCRQQPSSPSLAVCGISSRDLREFMALVDAANLLYDAIILSPRRSLPVKGNLKEHIPPLVRQVD